MISLGITVKVVPEHMTRSPSVGLMQLPVLRGESLWTQLGVWPQLLLWLGFLSRTCFSTDERQSP